MTKEEAIIRMANTYWIEASKNNLYIFKRGETGEGIFKSKFFNHFEKAAGYRSIKGWKPEVHIKCCFEKFGAILPFRIYGKSALEAWNEYHHRYEGKQSNDFVVQMLNTFKKIKKWKGEYNPEYYRNNIYFLKRKNLSIHFLSLSKEFRKLNEEIGLYDVDTLNFKRAMVFRNKKLVNKMKEVFGKDFY